MEATSNALSFLKGTKICNAMTWAIQTNKTAGMIILIGIIAPS